MVVAIVCVIGYIIAGFVKVWWITLGLSLAILFIVLVLMKKYTQRGNAAVKADD